MFSVRKLFKETCLSWGNKIIGLKVHTENWLWYLILVVARRMCEYVSQPGRMRRCMAGWKIFLEKRKKRKIISEMGLQRSETWAVGLSNQMRKLSTVWDEINHRESLVLNHLCFHDVCLLGGKWWEKAIFQLTEQTLFSCNYLLFSLIKR